MSTSILSLTESVSDMAIVTGNANGDLAHRICTHLHMGVSRVYIGAFSDGEVRIELLDNMRGRDVYIIQSVCSPVNRSLMELMLIADAARRSSARQIIAVVPYLGYSRQDRRPRSDRVPISARVIADMLTGVGITRLVTIDLHAEQIQGFYNMPVDNIYASPVLLGDLTRHADRGGRHVMVSPDVGGVVRARAMATAIDAELTIIDKRRPGHNQAEVMHVIGEASGRNCYLIDDLVDTAGTLCAAARELRNRGAVSVRAYCTHPVLSGDAVRQISESALDEVVVADTIPLAADAARCAKIRVLDISELLAETLIRIHQHLSVSSLFID